MTSWISHQLPKIKIPTCSKIHPVLAKRSSVNSTQKFSLSNLKSKFLLMLVSVRSSRARNSSSPAAVATLCSPGLRTRWKTSSLKRRRRLLSTTAMSSRVTCPTAPSATKIGSFLRPLSKRFQSPITNHDHLRFHFLFLAQLLCGQQHDARP